MSEESDKAEILAVIHAHRTALWTHDFEAYSACFVHAPYMTRWNVSLLDGIFVRSGWDDIAARVRTSFADPTWRNTANAYETQVVDLQIHLGGDMAWATYIQIYPAASARAGRTHEMRCFERRDGRWLIAFLAFMDDRPHLGDTALIQLDPDGTVLWQGRDAASLIEADDDLVIRSGRLRIRDSRADQKLQAAVKWAAGLGSGFISSRGALPIVLEAGEGLPTKIWWVIAESVKILFSLGEPALIDRRLDAAAVVYGLSPTQKRLAAYVAEGLTLAEIAERMQITTNTARTHLNRVIDKTGVRTQPALVRVLLTAAAPL